jgi:REP element-mobilizing transposase RayT
LETDHANPIQPRKSPPTINPSGGIHYKQSGAYFVTIVTQNRTCLLGDIMDGEIVLNDTGQIAQASWNGLPSRFPVVSLDFFVVMPNHIHGIIMVGAPFIAPNSTLHNNAAIFRAVAARNNRRAYLIVS